MLATSLLGIRPGGSVPKQSLDLSGGEYSVSVHKYWLVKKNETVIVYFTPSGIVDSDVA